MLCLCWPYLYHSKVKIHSRFEFLASADVLELVFKNNSDTPTEAHMAKDRVYDFHHNLWPNMPQRMCWN